MKKTTPKIGIPIHVKAPPTAKHEMLKNKVIGFMIAGSIFGRGAEPVECRPQRPSQTRTPDQISEHDRHLFQPREPDSETTYVRVTPAAGHAPITRLIQRRPWS
jgi:hypothetical protein